MEINQCLHVAVLVSDLEKAEDFYGKILGLSKVERELRFPGAWYQVGQFQIHLMVNPNAKVDLKNPEKWGRNPHIAFSVVNLDEAKECLQAHGYPIQLSSSGRAALFTQDPDCNIIELSQISKIST
ncbi:MAG: glyoxalase [Moorea sp. SIO3I7]|uniref:VOC family protein n=1 Tax=unclassified Moorena TaxID=2683338 RepID=UPI0013BEE71A|nr:MULTISPECIES: VOC family protein [unclassified Moorena]NEN98042.1 glyoxalase [Moorena sp. SIO3I7]NEO06932.1 glyoxalase [Moorena sp. SIO3I8]NEP23997.1 glyoxalase [Moorena sp. SIO3I6]